MKRWRLYPIYKPSGIEWLGEIPGHWDMQPLKQIFLVLNGSTPKSGEPDYWDGDIPWATPDDLGNLKGDTLLTTRRMITVAGYHSCGTSLAPEGSLVLSTRAPIGYLAIAGVPLCTNQGCRCLVFRREAEKRYYYYLLLTANQELESWGQGSTFRELGRNRLTAILLLLPPLDEQRAIASFLDRETARIDALVATKEHFIELLAEKRTALISQAVTKGLDPDVPLKDSGVEWLGEIPGHWEVKRLKHIARINLNTLTEGTEPDYVIKYIDIGNVGENGLLAEPEKMIFGNAPSRARRIIKKDNVIISTVRTYLKAIAHFPNPEDNLVCSTGFAVLEPGNLIIPRFLYYLAHCDKFIETIMAYSVGLGYPAINTSVFAGFPVWLPTISEQETIAAYLDTETAKIDSLITKTRKSIEKLKEYRTALVSAAVTGKIDVRKEAP
jgi:type I restriction enzyme S subunit